ncbi:MAG: SRPBCC domain-containing protein [Planctomycetota bacterium]
MSTDIQFEDGNLIVTRIYDAPREAVFEAWVETSKVEQWWGCAQTTAVRSEIEPRVGGKYNHLMTLEGVGDVPSVSVLVAFDPPERIAFESPSPAGPDATMTVTVEFTDLGDGRTQVRLTHAGIPDMRVDGDIELREIIRTGWTAAFGKLAEFLGAAA